MTLSKILDGHRFPGVLFLLKNIVEIGLIYCLIRVCLGTVPISRNEGSQGYKLITDFFYYNNSYVRVLGCKAGLYN